MKFSRRMKNMKASEIREILKLTQRPEIISFAGGLPAPELFPVEQMAKVSQKVISTIGREALQYSTTEGYDPLRKHIVDRMSKMSIETTYENILVTSGSQQGLEFSGKIFLDPDDIVICESPSYLGAINAFKSYECQFREIQTDEHGMIMSHLEETIKENPNTKFIYVIPDFQNPSGRTWSLERRQKLIEIANKYDLVIVEDNPYGELRYEGEHLPAVKSLDTEGRVVFLGTFSKTFAPGLRIGWVCAEDELLNKYIMIKQGSDLQTSSMSQRELAVYLEDYSLDEHIEKLIGVYKTRRNLMIDTMKSTFPKEARYIVPEGGLFIWVELPEHIDTKELMVKAVEEKVAFVPGGSFFPNSDTKNTMRLNFSNMNEENIVEGITRLGKLLNNEM
ncbi:MAG: PLP-dependent aminotransferase family protein [Clostridiales bacterium]|nr:PLP-dependent aminotransferase family protein [Clostridiales bacterium]